MEDGARRNVEAVGNDATQKQIEEQREVHEARTGVSNESVFSKTGDVV
jgi:hypothetical protein